MTKKHFYFLFAFLLGCFSAAAQEMTIKGKLTDATDGSPLPGASVTIPGTNKGVTTTSKGEFTIKVPGKNTTLRFSFIGYITKDVKVTSEKSLNITLNEDSKLLNEVVVTALGITRDAKSLGYARQTVDIGSMTESRSANLANMLAGKVAGLNVIPGGGPTASTRIEIRGNKSFTGNNQPLWVIDGVMIQNDMGEGEESYLDYGNIAGNINPDDIESIEVLKGANAAALYGADAATGVILVTTKKAAKQKGFGITYSLNAMFGTINQWPEFQNVYGGGNSVRLGESNKYRNLNSPNSVFLSVYNARSWGIPMIGFDVVGRDGNVKSYTPNPNNVYDYYSTSHSITNNVSVSKANDQGQFRFSYSNTSATDVLKGANERNRHNLSLRAGYNIHRNVNVEGNVRYTIDKINDRAYSGWNDRNPMMAYLFLPRDASLDELTPWKDASGNALKFSSAADSEFKNPLWSLNECWNEDTKKWLLADLSVNINLTHGLKLKLKGAADIQSIHAYDFTNKGTSWQVDGKYKTFNRNIDNYQWEGLLSYDRKFKNFSISANAGASWREYERSQITSLTENLIVHDVASLSNSAEAIQTKETEERRNRKSIYAAVSLGFRDYLYVDVTGRNDWDSTLPINNCSYFYPSVSGSFVFSEAFDLPSNIISFGKLRASWAKVGNGTSFNQLFNNYIYDGLFNGIPIYNLGSLLKNSDLKPETTYSTEVGFDLRFLNSRLNLDATYYYTKSVDQIMRRKIPTSIGFTDKIVNSGVMENKGIEVSINAVPVKTKNFTWDMTFNISKNNNKVVSIADNTSFLTIGTWSSGLNINIEEGEPYGVLRGVDIKYDENGVAMIQENGRPYTDANAYLGNVQPKFMGSFGTGFKYKDFDLNLMLDFKCGGKFFSASAFHGVREGSNLRSLQYRDEFLFSQTVLGESSNERMGINDETKGFYSDNSRAKGGLFPGIVYVQDSETGEYISKGPNTNYISPQTYWQNASGMYSFFIYDASYIKLREITLGYTIPKKIIRKTPLRSVRFALVGRNLWTIFQNTPKGIDPQATATSGNAQGLEAGYALPTAYYGFDLKVSF